MEPVHRITTNSSFNQNGYLYIPNVLTEEERLQFTNIMLLKKEQNLLHFEPIRPDGKPNPHYTNCYGGDSPEFEEALKRVQVRLEEELGIKLAVKNSYGRIYYNGGILGKHRDREGLDYTLSITLFSNLNEGWPLWCIDLNNNHVPIAIGQGDGALMLGTTLEHWREPLVCNDDQYVIQLFMHWA